MKKKLISTLLILGMLAASLVGCGSKEDSAPAADSSSATKEEAPAADTSSDDAEAPATVDAADLEPVTLHFIFFGDKKSATDEVWAAIAAG